MDATKIKKTLRIIFEYSDRVVGYLLVAAAFPLYLSEAITTRTFIVSLGAGVALGFFGPKAKLDFFNWRKPKDTGTNDDTTAAG